MPEPSGTAEVKVGQKIKAITPKAVNYVDGPGYSSFYVNNVGFSVNQLDIVLLLGEIIDITTEHVATVERRARVTMTPAQAKALGKILEYCVAAYQLQSKKIVEDLPMNFPELPNPEAPNEG
jgi:hypothetical protein